MAKYQGGPLDDTKDGGDEQDTFYGSWGDDTLSGGGDNDTLDGQEGNDHLYGNSGDDALYGDRGILFGGNDHLYGGSGNDSLHGGRENDYLYGGSSRDWLFGDADNDHLYGESGNDDLYGGSGDDYVSGGDGDDYISDSNGVDELRGGDGDDIIVVNGGDLLRFDLVYGGSGNDTIYANDTNLIVDGGSGNDTIFTEARRDTYLEGGTGSDRFVIDFAPGDGVDEWIDVLDDGVQIYGGEAHLVHTSVAGGADIIWDHYQTSDTSVDTLELSQWGTEDGASVDLVGNTFGEGEYFIEDAPYYEGQAFSNNPDYLHVGNIYGIENVVGTAERDQIWGDGVGNNLSGLGGNDYISGNGGTDVIQGGVGDDNLDGGSHDDALYGGADNDHMTGGTHSDYLVGGAGNDVMFGDTEPQNWQSYMNGYVNVDVLDGGAGDDTLDGGDDGDYLYGGAGHDTISGGAGNDVIYGDTSGQVVGFDTLTGGAGADRFVFTDVGRTITGTTQVTTPGSLGISVTTPTVVPVVDTITDFDAFGADHDVIDISEIIRERTNFHETGGFGVQDAIARGYIYAATVPGQSGVRLMVDLDGSTDGLHNDAANQWAVADLPNANIFTVLMLSQAQSGLLMV